MAEMFNPQNPEILELNRQRKMAELLTAQGMQTPQGQTVAGGIYVPPNPMEYIGKLFNTYIGTKANEALDKKELDLAQKLRELGATETKDILGTAQGTPEVVTELAGPAYKGVAPSAVMPAKEGDVNAALAKALMGQSPQAQALVPSLIQSALPKKTDKMIEYELYKAQTPEDKRLGFTDWADRIDKQKLAIDQQRLGLEAARFNLEKSKQDVNPNEAPLRTQFLGQIQPHIQISQAYSKITTAPDSAAGDMSKIFGFMKILDPGSTVREGEYASAEQTRGIPEAVVAQYNKAVSGRRLTAEQREKFDQAAGDLVLSQQKQFNQQKQFFTDVALSAKANPNNVIFDPYQGLEIKTTPAKPLPPNVNKQLNIPSTNLFNAADAIISGKK